MTKTPLFRQANSDDLDQILVWTESLMEHESHGDEIEVPLANDIHQQLKKWLSDLIHDNSSLVIIAQSDIDESRKNVPLGMIIGLLQLQPNEFTQFELHGVIQMLWVSQQHRKQGLARQLVNHMEQTFSNLNVPYCEVQYSTINGEAEGFWQNLGYTPVSVTSRKILNK